MELPRKQYIQKLISKKDNGRVKIVTGIVYICLQKNIIKGLTAGAIKG